MILQLSYKAICKNTIERKKIEEKICCTFQKEALQMHSMYKTVFEELFIKYSEEFPAEQYEESPIKPAKVIISHLAFLAAFPVMPAMAAPSITCSQALNFGGVLNVNGGTLVLKPNSAYSSIGGVQVITAPQPGQCFIQTTAKTPAASVIVEIGTKRTNLLNGTGEKLKVTDFNIDTTSGGRTQTYNGTSLAAGFSIDIGGSAEYGNNQSIGAYTGTITLTITTP